MPLHALRLIDRLSVPGDPEPAEAIQDRLDGRLGRALAIGILDPQEHLAAAATRIEPIEQRRAAAADMQESGGRGGKSGDDGLSHLALVHASFIMKPAPALARAQPRTG